MAQRKRTPAIIVHGGAWDIPDDLVKPHLDGCRRAVEAGYSLLREGASALDAVVAAVKVMEDDPAFDAGVGAFLNAEGEIELDASLMDGRTLGCGAVAGVKTVKNPIELARLVMERTEYVMLIGSGAEAFARQQGIPACRFEDLLVPRERERWQEFKRRKNFSARGVFATKPHGTVGAVAVDSEGNLAAANSTGGTPNKLPGRVGDTGQIGSGTYADNEKGAACSTGWGEPIIKIVMAKAICDRMAKKTAPKAAINQALNELRKRVGGFGGAIAIDRTGRVGLAFNTPRMAFAYSNVQGDIVTGI